jgi:hypothetical protein
MKEITARARSLFTVTHRYPLQPEALRSTLRQPTALHRTTRPPLRQRLRCPHSDGSDHSRRSYNLHISVTVNGDTLVEANEMFFVDLANVVNARVLDGQGQERIRTTTIQIL